MVGVVVGERRLTGCGLIGCGVPWWWHNCICVSVVVPRGGRVYRWCGLRRCRDRFVPPVVVLVQLCELVLPRGMPQKLSLFDSMAASGSSGSVGGYNVVFLTTEQPKRFAAVRIKLCENKAVDIEDLEKYGMHSIVEAIERMKWMQMVTIFEPGYPDLAKAFYTCLKTKEDGSLFSTVKGTSIHISYDLLERLFGVSTVGHRTVDSVDMHAKGLGIIGREYKLKDGKIDINQLNAFNRILHFIVCQILVPRSATFSTCPKGDSDMMFWAIQNQSMNMARTPEETGLVRDKVGVVLQLPFAHCPEPPFCTVDDCTAIAGSIVYH
ncbi:hypothetical protein Taro_048656 [Colocasia esculenta]|uniref:Uncharacterized protein n=1 Tax=Colocasia esculenta TaxID=4460 RepID=A0A843X8R0_COLES|nr:hypothetical protein [Colocasia esculenta]